MKTALRPEIESTYEIAVNAASGTLRALYALACSGITVDTQPLHCVGIRSRACTYFYRPTCREQETVRFIFQYKQRRIVGRLSVKRWDTLGNGPVKFHCADVMKPHLDDCAAHLRHHPYVVAALFKAQCRYTFRSSRGGKVKLALDAMVPFQPDAPAISGDPFFHMEIETEGQCDPDAVACAIRHSHPDLSRMVKTGCSKQEHAECIVTGQPMLHFATGHELRKYLEEIYRDLTVKLEPWTGQLLTHGVRLCP